MFNEIKKHGCETKCDDVEVTLYTRILEMFGSILVQDSGYPDRRFTQFFSVPQANAGMGLDQVTTTFFHIRSNSLFIYHPTIRCSIVQVLTLVLKQKRHGRHKGRA
jgi:hypothetical protein